MGGLSDMLAKAELRQEVKEANGVTEGRFFEMNIEVTKNDELTVPPNEDLQNGGKFIEELSSGRRGTRSVDCEEGDRTAGSGNAQAESF